MQWWIRMALCLGLVVSAFAALPAISNDRIALAEDATVEGACDEDAFQAALDQAHTGDGGTITFDPDDCPAGTTITFDTPKEIDNDIEIDGDDRIALSGGDAALDPENRSQLFRVTSAGEFTVRNIELINGGAADPTGDHIDRNGGAIYNNGGTVTIESSTVAGNEAANSGGAIYLIGGHLEIDESTFMDNHVNGSGGAVGNLNAIVTISNSTFEDNSAGTTAGAIVSDTQEDGSASVTISGSTFASNQSDIGGGAISIFDDPLTISNSTFFENTSGPAGGTAILVDEDGTLSVFSSTFFSEAVNTLIQVNGSATFSTSILTTPSGLNCDGIGSFDSGGYNLTDDTTCGFDQTGDSQGDANLGDLAGNGGPTETMLPNPPSDAIDAIPAIADICSFGATINDQRDFTRPRLDGCDIGAVELQLSDFPEQTLCANRYNGDLRMPRTDNCASTEVLFTMPDDGAIATCVNRYNGNLRYSPTGGCASTETPLLIEGLLDQPVCVNRYNGDIRVPQVEGQCASTEAARMI